MGSFAEGSAPRVLVAFASRHGSTEAIALEIARRLAEGGCVPTTRSAELSISVVGGADATSAAPAGSAVNVTSDMRNHCNNTLMIPVNQSI